MRRLTQEQFLEQLAKINPDIEPLDEFTTIRTPIRVRCKKCGTVWEKKQVPRNIMYSKRQCPYCVDVRHHEILPETFYKKVESIGSDFEILGEYVKMGVPIKVRCKLCGMESYKDPRWLVKYPRCTDCNSERRRYLKSRTVETISEKYDILDDFEHPSDWIHVRCKRCGRIQYRRVSYLRDRNAYCIDCSEKALITDDEFRKRLQSLTDNIHPVNAYHGMWNPILFKCSECGKQFIKAPFYVLHAPKCPQCQRYRGEAKIALFLDRNNINFSQQKDYSDLIGTGGGKLKFDFYLPDYNLLIEYQGEFHDGTMNKFVSDRYPYVHEHDKLKREYVKKHSINLLEIWYYDFDKIEEILADRLNIEEPVFFIA